MAAFKCYEVILNNYDEFFEYTQANNNMVTDDSSKAANSVKIPYSNIISAISTAIESEKDPRNLVVSFSLTSQILAKFGNSDEGEETLKPFLEDIFENISCYYPIEFNPPKNDKFKITPKDLKDGLNKCFTATPLLANHTFPFIFDKLTAVGTLSKTESLVTLRLMIEELPIQKVREFCEIIWNHLQNEAFNSTDEVVQVLCLNTISQLCATLDKFKDKFKIVQFDSISEKVIGSIFQRCRVELENDPDTITGILACNLLCEIMKKSFTLCYLVIDTFLLKFSVEAIVTTKVQNQ